MSENAHTQAHERACNKFNKLLSGSGLNDLHHIAFSRINPAESSVMAISNNYSWHVNYWESGLVNCLSERIQHEVKTWFQLSEPHRSRAKAEGLACKIDICTLHDGIYDLFSAGSRSPFTQNEIIDLNQVKPKISSLATELWIECAVSRLTYEERIDHHSAAKDLSLDLTEKNAFGSIELSDKELQTIKLLLHWKSIKEIAFLEHVSENQVRRRIKSIKNKFGNERMSDSSLFEVLKKHGVILACLGACTISH